MAPATDLESTGPCAHEAPDDDSVEVVEDWQPIGLAHELQAARHTEQEVPVPEPEHQLMVESRRVRCTRCGEPVTQERIAGEE